VSRRPRFVVPQPNCGHIATTFTHDVLRELWICVKCAASLLGLSPRCCHCGLLQGRLIDTLDGRLCLCCFYDRRMARR